MKLQKNIRITTKKVVCFECLKCGLVWLPRKTAIEQELYRCASCKCLSLISLSDRKRVKAELAQIAEKSEQIGRAERASGEDEQVAKSKEKAGQIQSQRVGFEEQIGGENATLV